MTIVGKYSLNGNANDSSGNGHNLTPSTVSWVNGKNNGAVSFNKSAGGQDCRIQSNLGLSALNSNKTYNIFFKLNSLPSGSYPNNTMMFLAHQLIINGNTRRFWRGVVEWTGSVYRLKFYGRGNYTFPTTPIVGKYYYLSFTTNASGQTLIYLDGNLIINSAGDDTAGLFGAIAYFFIGGANLSGGTSIEGFDGVIDEVEVYNTALTPAEIKNKYLYYNGFM